MRKIYLVTLIVLVGLGSANQLTLFDFYSFGGNETDINNSTSIINLAGFQDNIMVFTKYNSTNQMSAIFYQDMVLFSGDKDIVKKISGLEAATVWG